MRIVALLALTACRINFDPLSTGDGGNGGAGGDGAPYIPTGSYTSLQLDGVFPLAPLTDFPLLVVLDDARTDRTAMQADALDLRIRTTAGVALPVEIEWAGAMGSAATIAWVKVPSITDTSTVLYASFGNTDAPPASTEVWSASYESVWHMTQAASDASGRGHDGTSLNTTTYVFGIAALATKYTASNQDAIRIPDTSSLGFAQLTAEAWISPTSLPSAANYASVITRELGTQPQNDFFLGLHGNQLSASINGAAPIDMGTVATNQFRHIAVTYDGTTTITYLDGVMQRSTTAASGPITHSANAIYIGADCDNGVSCPTTSYFDGFLDEVRLSTVARSQAWLRYGFAAANDQVITYVRAN